MVVLPTNRIDHLRYHQVSNELFIYAMIDVLIHSFTLGEFRPKQSLGQNFLSDQNYVVKIVNELVDNSIEGRSVIEIGPGPGSLTRVLLRKYPKMTAIEIDQRAIKFLNEKLPSLNVIHQDVLTVDWPNIAAERDGPVNIIANLPYHIVSQVLFTLADSHKAINKAIVTTQYEVAERIVAKPSTKEYGILSVVFQLYATPKMNFKIPPTVFYPQPKVDSALVTIDFTKPHPGIYSVDPLYLKKVIHTAFRQRRKMIRASLKELIATDGLSLPEKWAQLRPEQLHPAQFIELTNDLYQNSKVNYSKRMESVSSPDPVTRPSYASEKPNIWRETKQKDSKQYEL